MSRKINSNVFKSKVGFDTKKDALDFVKKHHIYMNRKITDAEERKKEFIDRLRATRNQDIVIKRFNEHIDRTIDEAAKNIEEGKPFKAKIISKVPILNRSTKKVVNKAVPTKVIMQGIKRLEKNLKTDKMFMKVDSNGMSYEFPLNATSFSNLDPDLIENEYYLNTSADMLKGSVAYLIPAKPTNKRQYSNISGAFFRHTLIKDPRMENIKEAMERYQVYTTTKESKSNCLVQALELSGVPKEQLQELITSSNTGMIPIASLNKFGLAYDYKISVKYDSNSDPYRDQKTVQTITYGNKSSENIIKLGLVSNHYFIDEKVEISPFAIKNFDKVKSAKNWWKVVRIRNGKEGKRFEEDKNRTMYSSFRLIRDLFKYNLVEPMPLDEQALALNNYKKIDFSSIQLANIKKSTKEEGEKLYKSIEMKKSIDEKDQNQVKRTSMNKFMANPLKMYNIECKRLGCEPITSTRHVNIFFDFETNVSGKIHKPFLCYYEIRTESEPQESKDKFIQQCNYIMKENSSGFGVGPDCETIMMDKITRFAYTYAKREVYITSGNKFNPKQDQNDMIKAILEAYFNFTMIAHNITYDFNFLAPIASNINIFKRAEKFIAGGYFNYKGIKFNLKDSWAIIPDKLSNFSSMFGFEEKKEVMPYRLYNDRNTAPGVFLADIDEALQHIKDDSDKKRFLENLQEWNLISSVEKKFKHIEYSMKYCKIDVEVLIKGYYTFRDWILKDFKLDNGRNIDINNYLTISSIATDYITGRGCYDGCVKVGGTIRLFLQQFVVGGRCMPRDNAKWHIKEKLNDFDACGLYTSAMVRLGEIGGFLKGLPKLLTKSQLNMDFLNSVDGYFVEVKIKRVNKPYHFPLLNYVSEDGSRMFSNDLFETITETKGIKKIKDQSVKFMDKISLEDAMKFHEIEEDDIEIIRGYYFNEGRNPMIGTVMKYLYATRAEHKKNKNKIEAIYKLTMNSSYGSTILGEQDNKTMFIEGKQKMRDFMYTNFFRTPVSTKINVKEGRTKKVEGEDIKVEMYSVTHSKPIEDHFNSAHIGIEILAMSKRIMNEVMCLAEDLDIKIYYQDTDSMHISDEQISKLAKGFKKTYKRELIGKDLGQFHCDFSPPSSLINQIKEETKKTNISVAYAVETIILGKKAYIDKVQMKVDDEPVDYFFDHARMKGIDSDSLKYVVDTSKDKKGNLIYDGKLFKMYQDLYKGKAVNFDLLIGGTKSRFSYEKNMTVSNMDKFEREVKFNGNFGDFSSLPIHDPDYCPREISYPNIDDREELDEYEEEEINEALSELE